MQLKHAVQWSMLAEATSRVVPPVVFLLLARLLTPEDFGVMTAAMMVVAFSQVFWEGGMSKALIQRQHDVEGAANVAFWVNAGLGVLIALALWAASTEVSRRIFDDVRVEAVLEVMTMQVLLSSIGAVHTALLQKSMQFKRLFWVRLATTALPGIASIPLALSGLGYWALVGGTLLGQAVQVVLLWWLSEWRPKMSFDTRVAGEMARFGGWVAVSGLMAWFFAWADSMIVGASLGSHDLGLYRTGTLVSTLVFGTLFGAVTPVLYSHLSRMDRDCDRVRAASVRVLRVLAFSAVPLAIIIHALGPALGAAVFGPAWQGIGTVIAMMALTQGLAWVVGLNGEVYRAMGRPSYETAVMVASLLPYLAVYIYGVQYGLEGFLWARLAATIFGVSLHLIAIQRLIGMAVAPVIAHVIVAATLAWAVTFGVDLLMDSYVSAAWADLLLRGLLCLGTVGALIAFVERNGSVRHIREILGDRRRTALP